MRAKVARRPAIYGIAALLAALVGLFVWFPARLAARALPSGVACEGAAGTLWDGRCDDLRIRGGSAGAIAWRLRRWPLFLGHAQGTADWQHRASGVSATFDLSRRRVALKDLRGVADVATLRALPIWPQGIIDAWSPGEGRLRIDLAGLEVQDGRLTRIVGVVDADGLVSLDRERATLGDLRLAWRDGPVPLGEISDRGGPLEVRASLRPVTGVAADAPAPPGGAWRLTGTVRARDAAWRPRLQVFGPPDAAGRHALSVEWR